MIIIFLILTFFLFIVVVLALVNVLKPKNNKILLVIGIIFWIVYSSFFWASFATQIKSFKRLDNFICDYYRLVYNTVFGSDYGDLRYVGVR